jgi:hypothetical protein
MVRLQWSRKVSNFPPSVPLAKLYEKQSQKGTQYFVGRLGAAKVIFLKTQETSESGEAVWQLSVQQPAQSPARAPAEAVQRAARLFGPRSRMKAPRPTHDAPDVPDDRVDDGEP